MKQSKLVPIILSSLILSVGEINAHEYSLVSSISEKQYNIHKEDFYFSGKVILDLQETEESYRV
jgi:hypothetical protein